MRATYRVDIAYDGTRFRGYARNEGVRTVQGVIEAALERVVGEVPITAVAGRTDAGVHARHNVLSFGMERSIDDPEQVRRSIDALVGPEIAISTLSEAEPDFDARFSATARSYRYFIDESPDGDPLQRHRVWHVGQGLDTDVMNEAASAFVGEHDFSSLCRAAEGRSLVRRVLSATWDRDDGLLVFSVAASSFCHQMVRSMVALCVDAGRGKVSADAVPGILAAKDRHAARGVAPPHGLTLWEVSY